MNNSSPARPTVEQVALEGFNRTITAQIGLLLSIQHPVTAIAAGDIIGQLMEHVAKLTAMLDAPVRADVVNQLRLSLPGLVDRHVTLLSTSPGGIIDPRLPN